MTKIENFEMLQKALLELYKKKNADYGDSFGSSFREYGEISALVRLSDKFERIKSLVVGKKQNVKDESIEDTLGDIANYCVMWIIERRLSAANYKQNKEQNENAKLPSVASCTNENENEILK